MPRTRASRREPQSPVLAAALGSALRMAATRDGAPGRCPRRSCRDRARCTARLDHNGNADCGGGVSARAVDHALDMVVFAYRLVTNKPFW